MTSLKLVALDKADLDIFCVHMQDAILRTVDMLWDPASHRFVALMNRFDWQDADAASSGSKQVRQRFQRHRCALRFDHVNGVQLKNIEIGQRNTTLSLLTMRFEPDDEPSGKIELIFAGDCSIRLDVECIEAELTDLGKGWNVRSKPEHEG